MECLNMILTYYEDFFCLDLSPDLNIFTGLSGLDATNVVSKLW